MSNDDPMGSGPSDLDAYRDRKRKEKFVLSAVERAMILRDLLTSALAGFHAGSAADRQIIGFALNDVLLHISPKEIDNLRDLLKKLESTRHLD